MHQQISACRVCGNAELTEILDLGMQVVSKVFPKARSERVAAGPLKLVKCTGEPDVCGLLQLEYIRGNQTLVRACPRRLEVPYTNTAPICGAVAIVSRPTLAGNPNPEEVLARSGPERFATETSIAILLDHLEEQRVTIMPLSTLSAQKQPMRFLQGIRDALDNRRICVIKERYMPSIMYANSYDSICHEYVAYYAMKQIKWLTDRVGLKIVNVELDSGHVQTASIALARRESPYEQCITVDTVLDEEAREGLHTSAPYRAFARRVTAGIELLRTFLDRARDAGKSVSALGATSEGNVILQCCRATQADIGYVGETDPQKIGAFTPGTLLPIVVEDEALARRPDFLLVLPWQLRDVLLAVPKLAGRNLLFPLPKLEFVRATSPR